MNTVVLLKWNAKESALKDILSQMKGILDRYHYLWSELEEIDETCWVLEPEHPDQVAYISKNRGVAKFCSWS